MNKNNVQIAMDAANEIADSFSPGFFDNRMVEDVAAIIAKHHKNFAASIINECIAAIKEQCSATCEDYHFNHNERIEFANERLLDACYYIEDLFGVTDQANDFNFDLERMKQAVESEKVSIPTEALASFEAFDEWLNTEEKAQTSLKDRLPNPFTVDYQRETGPLDLYTEVEMLKFAESIINECAMLTLDYKNDDHYNGWLDFRDHIREHFGVKQ